MITKLYIVRHTRTVGNDERRFTGRKDYEITEEGKIYIQKLTDRLKEVKFDKMYSSTSGRAIKTIEPLAKLNGLEIETNENLCEMYFGIYDGWKWEDVNKVNPKIDELHKETNEIMEIPEQESTKEVANRVYNYIRAISIENSGKVLLIASHGIAIETFIRKVNNEEFTKNVEANSQKNTSVNIVEYDSEKDKFKVLLLNDLSHLNQELER